MGVGERREMRGIVAIVGMMSETGGMIETGATIEIAEMIEVAEMIVVVIEGEMEEMFGIENEEEAEAVEGEVRLLIWSDGQSHSL